MTREEEEQAINNIIQKAVDEFCAEIPYDWRMVIPLLRHAGRLADAAAQVVHNCLDAGTQGPSDKDVYVSEVYPCDEEGRIWYPDLWEIHKVLEAIDHDTAAYLRLCPHLDPKARPVS